MKMSMMMAAILGGMGFMGYMYLKKHPEMKNMMMQMGKDTSRKMYNMFDEEV